MKTIALLTLILSWSMSFSWANTGSDSLYNKAIQLRDKEQWEEAESYFKKALSIAEKQDNTEKQTLILNNLNNVQFKLGKYKEAILSTMTELEVHKKNKDDTLCAITYYNLGLNYKRLGDFNGAIENFSNALVFYQKIKDKNNKAKVLNAIGNVQRDLNNPKEAIEYHLEALTNYSDLLDSTGIAKCFQGLGQDYIELNQFEKGRNYLLKAKAINLILDRSTASNNAQIGNSFLAEEKYDSAEFYFFASHTARVLNGNKSKIATSHKHLGAFFLNMKNNSLAMIHLDSAYYLGKEMGLNQELLEILELQIHLGENNYSKTEIIEKQKEYITLYKVILGENSRKGIAALKANIELLQKNQEIEWISNEVELKNIENDRLNDRNAVFLLGSILFALFSIIIILYYVKLRKSKAQTDQKNSLLETKNKLIDNLHKELSHRTKNYFNMFGGMLSFDKKRSANPEVIELLNKYGSRVEAMSQIQRYLLVEKTASKEVQLDLYLSDLLSNIDLVLNNKIPKVEINKRFETISFDYDKAMKLGLVMNETVGNAFEHGFANHKHPTLEIVLTDEKNEFICLDISDNGEGFKHQSDPNSTSMGIKLMKMILKSISGELTFSSSKNGTIVHIKVPK